jgi:hypothetical protein
MNNLKKALLKDDLQKYQKNHIQISNVKKSNKWKELDDLIEGVTYLLFRDPLISLMWISLYKIQCGTLFKLIIKMN